MRSTKRGHQTFLLTTALFVFAVSPSPMAGPSVPSAPTPTPIVVASANTTAGDGGAKGGARAASAAEWPQWRGPNRDGRAAGVAAPRAWPNELKPRWRVTVGIGHSSPVVSGGVVYQFARQGDEEVLLALNAATGKELWRSANPASYEVQSAARAHGKGPKATPVVAGGRVFTFGITGVLSAHEARTGKLLWRKDFSKQFPATSPVYGTAASPLVDKNILIAHVGGNEGGALTAFDAATGAVKWAYEDNGPSYSSPVILTAAGERQIITFTRTEMISVSVANGKLLWKYPIKVWRSICDTPVVYKDTVIFSAGQREGLVALRPVREGGTWAAREVWRNTENNLFLNTPVLQGETLYGMSERMKGQLFAVDAATGKTLWQGPGKFGENAAIVNLAGTLLVLSNDATLYVLPTGTGSFAPVTQYTVASSPTWAHPVPLGDSIFVKDETTLASLAIQ